MNDILPEELQKMLDFFNAATEAVENVRYVEEKHMHLKLQQMDMYMHIVANVMQTLWSKGGD